MKVLFLNLANLLTILAGFLGINQITPTTISSLATTTLAIGGINVVVEIANTDISRAHGLSDRATLDENRGMLFVFGRADYHSFWMKDMRFPLDIIWLDDNWRVIDVTENISPESFPATYQPRAPTRYVLE